MLRIHTASVTIPNGTAAAPAVTVPPGMTLIGIAVPAAWTAAALCFQVSYDGATYGNYYSAATGAAYVIASTAVVAAGSIKVPEADFQGAAGIIVQSGVIGTLVNQGANRTLTLVFRSITDF
jgi:hypothetical protein